MLLLNLSFLNAQSLKEIANIEINQEYLQKNFENQSTEFLTSNNKKIGSFYSYEINDIINKNIQNISKEKRNNLIIIAENNQNQSIATTYYDYSTQIIKLTPLLLSSKVTGIVGDTVRIGDAKGKKGVVDTYEVGKAFDIAVRKRIFLQIKSLKNEEKNNFFQNGTIIFPQDQSTERWLKNVSRIKIYLIE